MEINRKKIYVVTKPRLESDLNDIWSDKANTLEELFNQHKNGVLEYDAIHGMYSTKEEAEREAKRIFKLHEKAMEIISGNGTFATSDFDTKSVVEYYYSIRDKIELLQEMVKKAPPALDQKFAQKHLKESLENMDEFYQIVNTDLSL